MTDKVEGMCSVCLRKIQLRDDRPIRHGFSAIGVKHGQNSGYHTGPCQGVDFPYLGVSDKGTRWALADVKKRLDQIFSALDRLKRRPSLTWYPMVRAGRGWDRVPGVKYAQQVNPGDETRNYQVPDDNRIQMVPDYEHLLGRHIADAERVRDELARAEERYEEILNGYSPEKYQSTGAVSKDVVHMAHEYNNPRFGKFTGKLCQFSRPTGRGSGSKLTTDKSKVTCKKCRKELGLS